MAEYVFPIQQAATTHGFGATEYIRGQERGAGAIITEVANIDIDAITINAPIFTPKFTKIDWQMKTTSLAGVTDYCILLCPAEQKGCFR